MKKLMDKQEAWMEKMMRTIEHKEQERILREEEWRKQDAARIEREHKFWASERASERAWIEARDSALMDALHKITEIFFPVAEEVVGPEFGRSLSENQKICHISIISIIPPETLLCVQRRQRAKLRRVHLSQIRSTTILHLAISAFVGNAAASSMGILGLVLLLRISRVPTHFSAHVWSI